MPYYQLTCPIIRKTHLTSGTVSLWFRGPQIAHAARPGQFVMLRVQNEVHPLLRRAFSISRCNPDEDAFEIMVQAAGTGSRILLEHEEGEMLDVLGPLGSSFQQVEGIQTALLVGGGIGIAPLFFLAQTLEVDYHILFGGRSHSQLFALPEFEPQMRFCTEDGSLGQKGLVTDLLQKTVQEVSGKAAVFACGPNQMLAAVAGVAEKTGIPCQVSMEAPMACGVGVCMGCPVPDVKGGYRYVCKDGPVFPAEMIRFKQLVNG